MLELSLFAKFNIEVRVLHNFLILSSQTMKIYRKMFFHYILKQNFKWQTQESRNTFEAQDIPISWRMLYFGSYLYVSLFYFSQDETPYSHIIVFKPRPCKRRDSPAEQFAWRQHKLLPRDRPSGTRNPRSRTRAPACGALKNKRLYFTARKAQSSSAAVVG